MNDFEIGISGKTDEELIAILCTPQDCQPEFIEFVQKMLREVRNISSCDDFFKKKSNKELLDYCDNFYKHHEVFIALAIRELNGRNIFYHYLVDEHFFPQKDCLGQIGYNPLHLLYAPNE